MVDAMHSMDLGGRGEFSVPFSFTSKKVKARTLCNVSLLTTKSILFTLSDTQSRFKN